MHVQAQPAGRDVTAHPEASPQYVVTSAQERNGERVGYVIAPETNRLLNQILEQLTALTAALRNED